MGTYHYPELRSFDEYKAGGLNTPQDGLNPPGNVGARTQDSVLHPYGQMDGTSAFGPRSFVDAAGVNDAAPVGCPEDDHANNLGIGESPADTILRMGSSEHPSAGRGKTEVYAAGSVIGAVIGLAYICITSAIAHGNHGPETGSAMLNRAGYTNVEYQDSSTWFTGHKGCSGGGVDNIALKFTASDPDGAQVEVTVCGGLSKSRRIGDVYYP